MISGSIVALVTPMQPDGQLDMHALRRLIDWHIAEGTNALVIVGTTGESPTLDFDEHISVIRVAVEHAAGRIPVIAGTGANSTTEAIELARAAREVGAQAQLSVVPYYNKPPQEGLYQHFKKIAEHVDLPMILYNVPGRTVADMNNDIVLRLAQIPGIVGIKDATGNIDRGAQLLAAVPAGFSVYSGDDLTAVALMLLGAQGNISVTANVAPSAMSQLCAASMRGDVARAWAWHKQLLPVHKALFIEANPIPVKWAMQALGKMPGGLRLPLVPLSSSNEVVVRDALRAAGVVV